MRGANLAKLEADIETAKLSGNSEKFANAQAIYGAANKQATFDYMNGKRNTDATIRENWHVIERGFSDKSIHQWAKDKNGAPIENVSTASNVKTFADAMEDATTTIKSGDEWNRAQANASIAKTGGKASSK